jgi:hypothetical protein
MDTHQVRSLGHASSLSRRPEHGMMQNCTAGIMKMVTLLLLKAGMSWRILEISVMMHPRIKDLLILPALKVKDATWEGGSRTWCHHLTHLGSGPCHHAFPSMTLIGTNLNPTTCMGRRAAPQLSMNLQFFAEVIRSLWIICSMIWHVTTSFRLSALFQDVVQMGVARPTLANLRVTWMLSALQTQQLQ